MTVDGLIPDEWLMSYAAGALTESEALLLATHVSYHPVLQARLADAEAIGGSLLEEIPPARLSNGALNKVMMRIDSLPDTANDAPPLPSGDSDIPQALRRYLGKTLADLRWRTLGPGLKQCRLASGPGRQRLKLLKAKAGMHIPVHDHGATEFTLVLRGGFRVGTIHFTPGLLEIADDSVTSHQPIIDEGDDCICLVITHARIRLHSWLGRLIQPFVDI